MIRTSFFRRGSYGNWPCVSREKCPQHMLISGYSMARRLVRARHLPAMLRPPAIARHERAGNASFRILPRSRDGKDRMAIWIVPRAKVRFINIRRSTMGSFTKTSRFSSKRYSRRQASCQGVYSITRQRVVSLPRLFSLWGISELKWMFSPTLSCLFLLSSVSSRLPSITYMNSSPSCL